MLNQLMGGNGQHQPELIGDKTVTAQPITTKSVFDFFDPVFTISSLDVETIINGFTNGLNVRDNETVVRPEVRMLCFGDNLSCF